jgi:hypothetical protein
MPFGIVSRTNGVPVPHPFPPQGFSFLSKKENSGACRFRLDIVDLPRDEDQQTAKTELTSVPSFQGATHIMFCVFTLLQGFALQKALYEVCFSKIF